jgi:nitrogen-specific signal transduction histidine kinase
VIVELAFHRRSKKKMFNPFFKTKPAGEGTGLGLSISHDSIVKRIWPADMGILED